MRDNPERPARRDKDTRTATDEALEELKEQGREEDTDISESRGKGSGDPISPSPEANEDAVENDPAK